MEAAAVARLAGMRGIPFYCIKGVSDAFDEKLPDFNRFISPDRAIHDHRIPALCSGQTLALARIGADGRE